LKNVGRDVTVDDDSDEAVAVENDDDMIASRIKNQKNGKSTLMEVPTHDQTKETKAREKDAKPWGNEKPMNSEKRDGSGGKSKIPLSSSGEGDMLSSNTAPEKKVFKTNKSQGIRTSDITLKPPNKSKPDLDKNRTVPGEKSLKASAKSKDVPKASDVPSIKVKDNAVVQRPALSSKSHLEEKVSGDIRDLRNTSTATHVKKEQEKIITISLSEQKVEKMSVITKNVSQPAKEAKTMSESSNKKVKFGKEMYKSYSASLTDLRKVDPKVILGKRPGESILRSPIMKRNPRVDMNKPGKSKKMRKI
jgi:hypothetical protein